jgi:tRNA A-37 threonylcarbamoyl transferase component Bud32
VSELAWVAPGLDGSLASASAELTLDYASARTLAHTAALRGEVHLKLRSARWRAWQRALPLHRMRWSLREARSLARLRGAGLPAVEPLAAGVRIGLRQGEAFLATRRCPGGDLELAIVEERAPRAWPDELAGALAALHAEGFVHRDAYLRNLVLDGERLLWIDPHRGGRLGCLRWLSPRGCAYDLACLELDLLALGRDREGKFFRAGYAARMPDLPSEARLRAAVERCKSALLARFLARRPAARAARAARLGLTLEELLRRWGVG